MNLTVRRTTFTNKSTIGQLFVDVAFECFTLEDVVRPVKIPGVTAIPEGVYVVVVSFSARFKRPLPELLNVPNFSGVRIHTGNTDANTDGCILVGQTQSKDFVGHSRAAFDRLFAKLQVAAQREKILLEVTSAAAVATTRAMPGPSAPVALRPPRALVPTAVRPEAPTSRSRPRRPAVGRVPKAVVTRGVAKERKQAAPRRSAARRPKK